MTNPGKTLITPVILSGGLGTRLWPVSRGHYPKQFFPLGTEESLLIETLRRFADRDRFALPLIIANDQHRFIVAEQAHAAEIALDAIILEPVARNTAPAIAVAAVYLHQLHHDAMMLVAPSDHVIRDNAAFLMAVEKAAAAASTGALVTFGITPDRPETGYGYIEISRTEITPGAFKIAQFVEKPDLVTAKRYLASGHFAWNGGMFLWRADRFIAALESHAPEILTAAKAALAHATRDLDFLRLDAARFAAAPSISVDYAVMEQTNDAAVVPAEFGWSDVGSWDALWAIGVQDAANNVVHGDVLALDCAGNYLRSDKAILATIGLADMIVVATDDAVLVAPRARAQDVKLIVDRLKARKE